IRVTSAPVSASSLAASAASFALNEPVRVDPAKTRILGGDMSDRHRIRSVARTIHVMAGHSCPKDGVASLAYDPAIHVLLAAKTWMPGTRPGMTNERLCEWKRQFFR